MKDSTRSIGVQASLFASLLSSIALATTDVRLFGLVGAVCAILALLLLLGERYRVVRIDDQTSES